MASSCDFCKKERETYECEICDRNVCTDCEASDATLEKEWVCPACCSTASTFHTQLVRVLDEYYAASGRILDEWKAASLGKTKR